MERALCGESSHFATLYLALEGQQDLMLVSFPQYGDVQQHRGMHMIPMEPNERSTAILRIDNTSMWGPISVTYRIKLSVGISNEANGEIDFDQELESVKSKMTTLQLVLNSGSVLLKRVEHLSDRIREGVVKLSENVACWKEQKNVERIKMRILLAELSKGCTVLTKYARERSTAASECLQRCTMGIKNPKPNDEPGGQPPGASYCIPPVATRSGHQNFSFDDVNSPPALSTKFEELATYSSDNLKLRAGDDFRLNIPAGHFPRPFVLQWEFAVLNHSAKDKSAIGFALLERETSGFLNQLIEYRCAIFFNIFVN